MSNRPRRRSLAYCRLFFLSGGVMLGPPPSSAADQEIQPISARRLVAQACLSRLSTSSRSYLLPARERLIDVAAGIAGDVAGGLPPEAHYVMLDVDAPDAPIRDRLASAMKFPTTRAEALRWFGKHGEHRGGILPWALEEQCHALGDAIRRDNVDLAATRAGLIVQLVADAALPLSATARRDGRTHLIAVSAAGRLAGYADVAAPRDRLHSWFIRRMEERLRQRLEASTDAPPHGSTDVTGAVFALLIDALARGDLMLEADAALIDRWGVADDERFRAVESVYLEELDRRCGALMASQLAAAAHLAAGLIDAAVVQPGPAPTGAAPGARPSRAQPSPSPPARRAEMFVGSKNSGLYHRRDCRHAVKIKAENMVTFADVDTARQAGRQPCSVCKPDQ